MALTIDGTVITKVTLDGTSYDNLTFDGVKYVEPLPPFAFTVIFFHVGGSTQRYTLPTASSGRPITDSVGNSENLNFINVYDDGGPTNQVQIHVSGTKTTSRDFSIRLYESGLDLDFTIPANGTATAIYVAGAYSVIGLNLTNNVVDHNA